MNSNSHAFGSYFYLINCLFVTSLAFVFVIYLFLYLFIYLVVCLFSFIHTDLEVYLTYLDLPGGT